MLEQIILAVDDQGNFLEYIPKEEGHRGLGKRHLAITVLIYNSSGQVLLQKRKHQIFDNIWDFTASTHPLQKSLGNDETIEEATIRALKEEYNTTDVKVKVVGSFNYFASYHTEQGDFCENEHCIMLVGEYNGKVNMNPSVGYEYKWVDKKDFLKDVETNPEKFAPWVIKGAQLLYNM